MGQRAWQHNYDYAKSFIYVVNHSLCTMTLMLVVVGLFMGREVSEIHSMDIVHSTHPSPLVVSCFPLQNFTSNHSNNSLSYNVNVELTKITQWLAVNRLSLNAKKD